MIGRLAPTKENFRSFVTNRAQGVNIALWPHPLIVIQEGDDLVIDHAGLGPEFDPDNEEVQFAPRGISLQFPHEGGAHQQSVHCIIAVP